MESSASTAVAAINEEELQAEVARLRSELQAVTQKLVVWKEKVKTGVDQMRQQVLDLTAALEVAHADRDALAQQLSSKKEVDKENHATDPAGENQRIFNGSASLEALSTLLMQTATAMEAANDWFFMYDAAKQDLFTTSVSSLLQTQQEASAGQPLTTSTSPASGGEDFEAYKRRVTTTLKLQAKNCETLQKQVQDLKTSEAALRDCVKERDRSLASRSETVALLERRLEVAERQCQQHEEWQEAMLRGPDMEQVNAIEERLEQEVVHVRSEYAARENAIFVQHQDELDRLRAMAEEDLGQLRCDYEERLAAAAVARNREAAPASPASSRATDVVYEKLLAEYEALKGQHRALERDNVALRRESAYSRTNALAAGASLKPNDLAGSLLRLDPSTLAEARGLLAEQQAAMQSLSEQLWSTKKSLLDLQRQKSAAPAAPGSLDPQQAVYLKSILVRVLCARREDKVLVNLLPVLSTMLNFGGNDLKHIYEANPSWISKK